VVTILFILSGSAADTFEESWALAEKEKRNRQQIKKADTGEKATIVFFMTSEIKLLII
jgi:hypothetical protein